MSYTYNWFSHAISVWEKLLAELKGRPNLRFLEIGCFEGRATVWLLENVLTDSSSQIICVDTFEGSKEHKDRGFDMTGMLGRFKENTESFRDKIDLRIGKSQKLLREMGSQPLFDFIYIDGSHLARDVLEDAVLSFGLLKQEGIMIFDDYRWTGSYTDPLMTPKPAIDAFLGLYRGKYKLLHKEYQVGIEKRI